MKDVRLLLSLALLVLSTAASASGPTVNQVLMMETVRHLSVEIGPRPSGSDEHEAALLYVAQRFEEMGYRPETMRFSLPDGKISGNVLARLEGVGPAPRRVLCMGAHLDSVRNAPGADDNASGVAVMLELARVLKSRPRSFDIVWVGFGSEEKYRGDTRHRHLGSRALAALWEANDRLPDAMLSIDMIGVAPLLRIRALARRPSFYGGLLLAAAQKHEPTARYARDLGPDGWSDHEPFERRGVPAAWIERRKNDLGHTRGDRFETVVPAYLEQTARIILDHLAILESNPPWE